MWESIVLAIADGHSDRVAIAKYVSTRIGREIPAVSIRREIHHMRDVLELRALDGVERVSADYRTLADEAGDGEQTQMFALSFQEIS